MGNITAGRLTILLCVFSRVVSVFHIPQLPTKQYVELRDINLGVIAPFHGYSTSTLCGNSLVFTHVVEIMEGMVYAVDQINANNDILPNTKLGFVLLDDCIKETTALAQALSFIPQTGICTCNDTCSSVPSGSPPSIYDVVGVIGSMKSSSSIAVATLLGPAQVPQISYSSSSDVLSDKALYPYFSRVVPPDKFQVDGIVSLIHRCGWRYISIVYNEGSYGELGFKNLKKKTNEMGICIGTSHKLSFGATEEDYDDVARNLQKFAKVVVMFLGPIPAKGLLSAVHRAGDTGRYVWVASDAFNRGTSEYWEYALGALTFAFHGTLVPDFVTWFSNKDPLSEKNPWFKNYWEKRYSCTFASDNSQEHCNQTLSNKITPSLETASTVMDAVLVFANALDSLLQQKCPDKVGAEARSCVTGPLLQDYLKHTSFIGYNGLVDFDENGDLLGKYSVSQVVRKGITYELVKIGSYDSMLKATYFNGNPISWDYITWDKTTSDPESVCSKPCKPGEFRMQKEVPCCWECRKCRSNEYIIANGTNCSPCPPFTWPDSTTAFTSCLSIQPTFLTWGEPLTVALLVFSVLGILASFATLGAYIYKNKSKCIKASSREVAYLMLGGIFLGYVTVLGLVASPDDLGCKVNFFCFCLSFSWIYSPLLTRTNRIYRIFESSKTSTRRPRFISPKSQLVLAWSFIFIQVIISIVICVVYNPTSHLTMPVRTEKYVELSCDFTVPGLTSFLVYNLVLVFVCLFFAFKTRKLPDNFNESRFISMCVYTTLVLWLAFIPSYFTAGRQYLKTVMLSAVLILNETVAICFLFLPKLYAAFYLENETRSNAVSSKFTRTSHVSGLQTSTEVNINFLQVRPFQQR